MDIKEQDILGNSITRHWYYRAKGAAMRRMLAGRPVQHVLDVGAGSGVFSRLLLDHGALEATCVDPYYPDEHDETHHGKPIHFVKTIDAIDVDTVLMMDVLEHVDDDTGLLRYYADRTPANTRFLITVPAFKWMWSGHDVFLEHRRRYTLPQVEAVVRAAGLQPLHGCYFYGLTLPLAAGMRLAGKLTARAGDEARSTLKQHSAVVNGVLSAICAVETGFFRMNRVGGLTVCCLAGK